MHMLANQGKVKLNTHEWDKATEEEPGGFSSLPEHVNKKATKKKASLTYTALDAIVAGIWDSIKRSK